MTNYEHIKQMTLEELAQFIDSLQCCTRCVRNGNNCFPTFRTEEWLNSEVKRNTNNNDSSR